ncbi:unnamed protein product (macronuclear) [Paramecium tetraurelia]|uniref:Uncharacterized protein n=1 Tax=Paramecium tetraurelia TaxID=5888 RepID=A0BBH1_PARTE|nr:uncharacterized protein GSPATT00000323001 [Paramecium tetraurelia]CAK55888.1 unnamed protein product [Paramecium tetraurelia]|eukprot:XP_001423286.1 hypothetical protein (macronuclear) [Paramecium tetraurelia strain d4-2]
MLLNVPEEEILEQKPSNLQQIELNNEKYLSSYINYDFISMNMSLKGLFFCILTNLFTIIRSGLQSLIITMYDEIFLICKIAQLFLFDLLSDIYIQGNLVIVDWNQESNQLYAIYYEKVVGGQI